MLDAARDIAITKIAVPETSVRESGRSSTIEPKTISRPAIAPATPRASGIVSESPRALDVPAGRCSSTSLIAQIAQPLQRDQCGSFTGLSGVARVDIKLRVRVPHLRVELQHLIRRVVKKFSRAISHPSRSSAACTRNGMPMNMSSTHVVYFTGVVRV